MTLLLTAEEIRAAASDAVVIEAARAAVDAAHAGAATVPPRMDVPVERGFLRVMPAAVDGVMGLKVMTLVEGLGTRYLILLYGVGSGDLLALLDADEVTRLRTAATTALAGEILCPDRSGPLGLVGTGFEAEGHLTLMARLWAPREVRVYSRAPERRAAFAERMSAQLGVPVTPVESAAAACDAPLVVLATKSSEPVVDGADFPPGGVVLSIGSTRPDLREIERTTLERAAALLVDDPVQVGRESGDIIDALACGVLSQERILSMGEGLAEPQRLAREGARDLLVFKSVGTAVQDLTLSRAVYDAAVANGRGRELGELTRLKRFATGAAKVAEGRS